MSTTGLDCIKQVSLKLNRVDQGFYLCGEDNQEASSHSSKFLPNVAFSPILSGIKYFINNKNQDRSTCIYFKPHSLCVMSTVFVFITFCHALSTLLVQNKLLNVLKCFRYLPDLYGLIKPSLLVKEGYVANSLNQNILHPVTLPTRCGFFIHAKQFLSTLMRSTVQMQENNGLQISFFFKYR